MAYLGRQHHSGLAILLAPKVSFPFSHDLYCLISDRTEYSNFLRAIPPIHSINHYITRKRLEVSTLKWLRTIADTHFPGDPGF